MKSLNIKPKSEEEITIEMKNLLLGKHRLGSKDWFIQKSMHAIMVQQALSPEQAIGYMVEQYKKNHKELCDGTKTIEQIKQEAVANAKTYQEAMK